ncbi:hypothetical protein AXG93_4128s1000 [Marchantia polymorpha subsp. ruderalis]|uniref:Uncharacterized protein n=1 Tax=Marchantia polymorpha subsp. ruderalis TaxID=1480154 RepID=A0A176VLT7_MARPO|nr:hypothetical protein AXG93_4128s1000 [Marchantia polymorpha subsp. ruderalis]
MVQLAFWIRALVHEKTTRKESLPRELASQESTRSLHVEQFFPKSMDMLPEPVSNILHRDIKRVRHLIDDVEERILSLEERVSSIQAGQQSATVKLHRRLDKMEMDLEDIQDALESFLGGSVGNRTANPHHSVSSPDSYSREEEAADKIKADGEDPQGSQLVQGSPSLELAEALGRIIKLENTLMERIRDIQRTLIHDVDNLKREVCYLSKQSQDLKEQQFLVKSPEQTKGPHEGMSAEQAVVDSEDGRAVASGVKLRDEMMTYFGGRVDHLGQVDLSLSKVEAGSRVDALNTTTIPPARSSQPFGFDLDLQRSKWDFAENRMSEEKTNMDIDTCVEDKPPNTLRSLEAEVQRVSQLPTKELAFIQPGALSGDQQLNSLPRVKQELPSIRDPALQRNCTGALEHQAESDLSSDFARANEAEKSESLKADSVDDEHAAAQTNKVLEAYGID